jgi:hypothetical protein
MQRHRVSSSEGASESHECELSLHSLNDDGLRAIAAVPIADRLWFAHTRFTDAGSASLVQQTKLKRCGLGSQDPASSGEAVAALVNVPLEELALLDNQATPAGVGHAARIKTLRKLDVSHAPTVGDESLPALAAMPKLEELILEAPWSPTRGSSNWPRPVRSRAFA